MSNFQLIPTGFHFIPQEPLIKIAFSKNHNGENWPFSPDQISDHCITDRRRYNSEKARSASAPSPMAKPKVEHEIIAGLHKSSRWNNEAPPQLSSTNHT